MRSSPLHTVSRDIEEDDLRPVLTQSGMLFLVFQVAYKCLLACCTSFYDVYSDEAFLTKVCVHIYAIFVCAQLGAVGA